MTTAIHPRKKDTIHSNGHRWVYRFDELDAVQEMLGGSWDKVRALLGGKGAGIADMTRAGIPVPSGFTVSTEACNAYMKEGAKFMDKVWGQVTDALKDLETISQKSFGNPEKPLLVSVRSGAKF
jgi:pyruvate,orthophosphate dikinase